MAYRLFTLFLRRKTHTHNFHAHIINSGLRFFIDISYFYSAWNHSPFFFALLLHIRMKNWRSNKGKKAYAHTHKKDINHSHCGSSNGGKNTMKINISTSELMWIGLKDAISSKLLPRLWVYTYTYIFPLHCCHRTCT